MLSDVWSGTQLLLLAQKSIFMILGIIGIGLIIAIHECGHFIFGKLFNINIPSFSIGFGPRIFSHSIGSTQFSISLIPIGGYVEAESGSYDNPTPGTIASLPYWKKLAIIGGGIAFNIIFSYIILSILFFQGLPQNPLVPSKKNFFIESIEKNSAAEHASLCKNDIIIKIDHQAIDNKLPVLLDYIMKHPHTTVLLTVNRQNTIIEVPVTLKSRQEGSQEIGVLGVQFNFEQADPLPLLEALQEGFTLTIQLLKNSLTAFTKSVRNKETKQFAGPLMMIKLSAQSASQGLSFFLFLLAYISIGIAVLNIIPLPIFDGGQALTHTIEAIIRRPIPEKVLNYIHLGCWILMLALFVVLTYQDILKMF